MEVIETNTHAFVIRLWREAPGPDEAACWRGHITHVLTGRRRSLQELSDIEPFVRAFLEATDAGAVCEDDPD